MAGELRVGLGFDVHPVQAGRELRLGGLVIEDSLGLAGHSDGDVVCHAVADALLGAAALGDLGEHFPDSDPAIEGIEGLTLLSRVVSMVVERGLAPRQCDLTVIAQRPAIGPRRARIAANLARALEVEQERVSVKATRPEGLGLSGDGVGCLAVAVLVER